jgi:type IV secretory pathway VirJ component
MKNNVKFLLVIFYFISANVIAQDLHIDTLNSSDNNKPLILYMTGDGGMNAFSKSFVKQWNKHGYPIVALNIKSYLWDAKSPDKAASDITGLLRKYMRNWKRQRIVLVGYSLGADVLPFIQTRLEDDVKNQASHVVLISPSATTDFEVHLVYGSKGQSVPAEINKLTKPTLVIFGTSEKDVPDKSISNKNVTVIKFPGDHHYDNDLAYLVQQISSRL